MADPQPQLPRSASQQQPSWSQDSTCAVCGDRGAKTHYGVLSCLGCKGFFRRALKKADQYECMHDNRCQINMYDRNSCRACRLQKCLNVGMDPAAVRPDRDFTGRQSSFRAGSTKSKMFSSGRPGDTKEEVWKKLPVEMRTMIMSLLNIEAMVSRGDTEREAGEVYPLPINSIREVIQDPSKLKGKRTEVIATTVNMQFQMRYEPYRMAKNEELLGVVSRRLVAAIDWVLNLDEMLGGLDVEDKICLVKSAFASLMLFKNAARTATVTNKEDILCVCNFAYVPRNMAEKYGDSYHLDNGLVARMLDEVVTPLRSINLLDEELVCLCAIIVLNPMARGISNAGMEKVLTQRNKIQETLFAFVKETATGQSPERRFGRLLLFLPIISGMASVVNENIRFAQTFSNLGRIPLLISLFGCFPVEPFLDVEETKKLHRTVETQTEEPIAMPKVRLNKRRLPSSFTNPVENDANSEFRLLQPPCAYTLTEMFDDRMNAVAKAGRREAPAPAPAIPNPSAALVPAALLQLRHPALAPPQPANNKLRVASEGRNNCSSACN